jgi:hypothetical protein
MVTVIPAGNERHRTGAAAAAGSRRHFGRIENDRVCLDVRTLTDEQVPRIAAAMGRIAKG